MIRADSLTSVVHDFFVVHARTFGLAADRVDVRYVLNWGGFVNSSFQISDGGTHLHLKLAVTEDVRAALERWRRLDPILRRHRAPPVLDWVEIGDAAGLLFPLLPGEAPALEPGVMHAVVDCLRDVWADGELAARLQPAGNRTAADCYLATYHDRFLEDLRAITDAPPPFVDRDVLTFMCDQAAALEHEVRSHPAFQQEVTTPIHGDLWLNNVLWEDPSSWYLLDWDDVQIGDPAMDIATLTGPTAADLTPLKRVEDGRRVGTPEMMERLVVLGRASLLDWVIDPLADWIEADSAPQVRDVARAEKERVYREALTLYLESYW